MDTITKPINEIVTVLPTTGTPGYRVILSSVAGWPIYEYDTNGLPVEDTGAGIGTIGALVGSMGDQAKLYLKSNAVVLSSVLTPYFPTGNTYKVEKCFIWNDRLLIARSDGSHSDIIVVFPNGNTHHIICTAPHITAFAVDDRLNLWVGTDTLGVYKYIYDDSIGAYDLYNVAGGFIPDNNISGLTACGEKVWIVSAHTTVFNICLFNGSSFIDKTAQFETDIGIDADAMTAVKLYRVTQNSSTMYLSMYDATLTGNLIYYDEAVSLFKVKALPTAFSGKTMTDFCKVGDNVYSVKANNGAAIGDAGVPYIWKFSDISEVRTAATTPRRICFNSGYVVFYNDTDIWRVDITLNTFVKELAWIADLATLAPNSYPGIVEMFCDDSTYLFILNATTYNDIIKAVVGLNWQPI